MLSVSNDYKIALTQPKTIDAKIIIGADTITSDDLNQIKRSFNSGLFKTVAKMVEIDSNTLIDKGTTIEPQFGVYLDNAFEYASLGTYKTKDDPVLKKDTNSYQIVAYDKIVESMVDYELTSDDITYPCTVRALMIAIFTKLGWSTSGIPNSFVNSSSLIEEDVYSGLNMTYRDVLDELCTISCNFLLDINNVPTLMDKNFLATLTSKSGTNISITDAQNEQIQDFNLKGDTSQSNTPTPTSPVPINVVTGGQYIKICGKNLIDGNFAQGGWNGQGTARIFTTQNFWVESGVTYTLSTTLNTSTYKYAINLATIPFPISSTTYRYYDSGWQTSSSFTFTPSQSGYFGLTIAKSNGTDNITPSDIEGVTWQLEKGNTASTYEAYTGNTYEINLGKNTFNGIFRQGNQNFSTTTARIFTQESNYKIYTGEKYTLSTNLDTSIYSYAIYIAEKPFLSASNTMLYSSGYKTSSSFTITSNYNGYLGFTVRKTDETNITPSDVENFWFQLEKGSEATSYSAYKTPIELCKTGTYQDKIYKDNGIWYLHKEIGKKVITGTDSTLSRGGTNSQGYRWRITLDNPLPNTSTSSIVPLYCDKLVAVTPGNTYNGVQGITIDTANNYSFFYITDTKNYSLDNMKTWLNTNNLTLYYILNNSTDTPIEDSELLEQLEIIEKAKTFKGINNITITSSNLSSPITFNYVSEVETIDENYMCDTNVEIKDNVFFNSLVFSRSADSDNIYRQDETSVSNNGLHEFKVSDLQITSLDWRDNFIDEMWDYIKDFSYYAYDVNTVGITFLEPLDEYYLSTFGDTYKTLMLNSDLTIQDGVNEKIYVNVPEETTTEYKYATTTDRLVNKASLIVDKQNGQIQGLVTTVNNNYLEITDKFNDYVPTSEYVTLENTVTTLQTSTYTKTEINTKLTDGSVTKVQTTSGTFDENGMRYEKTNAKTSTLINEKGVEVDNATTQSELFFAGYDENINQTIVRTDNINVRNFLTIGNNTRIQDYENGGGMFIL